MKSKRIGCLKAAPLEILGFLLLWSPYRWGVEFPVAASFTDKYSTSTFYEQSKLYCDLFRSRGQAPDTARATPLHSKRHV